MTREEAINIMNAIVYMLEPQYDTCRIEDAVEMAIKALEQEPCEDAISRQAAIEAIYDNNDRLNIAQAIRELPSVISSRPTEPCSDAISRRAVLDMLGEMTFPCGDGTSPYDHDSFIHNQTLADASQMIQDLPSVNTQEPKTGHWKQISPARIYECDICGQNVMTDDISAYRYCHGCGAKMIESQESEGAE